MSNYFPRHFLISFLLSVAAVTVSSLAQASPLPSAGRLIAIGGAEDRGADGADPATLHRAEWRHRCTHRAADRGQHRSGGGRCVLPTRVRATRGAADRGRRRAHPGTGERSDRRGDAGGRRRHLHVRRRPAPPDGQHRRQCIRARSAARIRANAAPASPVPAPVRRCCRVTCWPRAARRGGRRRTRHDSTPASAWCRRRSSTSTSPNVVASGGCCRSLPSAPSCSDSASTRTPGW